MNQFLGSRIKSVANSPDAFDLNGQDHAHAEKTAREEIIHVLHSRRTVHYWTNTLTKYVCYVLLSVLTLMLGSRAVILGFKEDWIKAGLFFFCYATHIFWVANQDIEIYLTVYIETSRTSSIVAALSVLVLTIY